MRPPQSASNRRSVCIFPFIFILAVVAAGLSLSPVNASAATSGQLNCDPCRLHFGTVVIGQSESLPVTLTNTEQTTVTITGLSSRDDQFSASGLKMPVVLAAGKAITFNVIFSPTEKHSAGGTITLTSNAWNKSLLLSVGGVGAGAVTLNPSPTNVAFGNVAVGSTGTLPVVLTNSGSTSIVLVQSQLSGASFAVSGLNLPMSLAAKQTVTFNVTFTPQSGGAASGSLVLPNASLTIPLSGTGTTKSQGTLSFNPTSVNFGDVNVGTTGTQAMSLVATGAAVTITSSSSSSSLFGLNGVSFPITLNAGQSLPVNVSFTPRTDGSASGTLTFMSDASDSRALEGLSGIGTSPQYTVSLTWNASNPPVAGYNVYRSNTLKGTYSKVNSSLDPTTTFTDSTVASGQTYYYSATSVSDSGEESGYSTAVVAVVP
jgi:hypothetical protein